MLLLSVTTLVGAQDGATQALPTGIQSQAPDPPKKDDQAPATADSNAAAASGGDNSTAPAQGD